MKIGIFGGTFDPIHTGHLIVAEEAMSQLGLDEVLFVPAGQPWFKTGQQVTGAHHRLAMVELAIASNPRFRASRIEVARPGPTYTVDTLVELRRHLGPDVEMYLILGMDALREMRRWRCAARVFDLATVAGVTRPGSDYDLKTLEAIFPGTSERTVMLSVPLIDIGATDLRRRVADGLSIRYLVPGSVEVYIREQGLYK